MDTLNDYYPLYAQNPETAGLSDSEISDNNIHVERITELNHTRKRRRNYTFDDFCLIHSDDLWYLWCIIKEFTNNSVILDRLEYHSFCSMCYENSTKC
jgi:hypothetical protein